MPPRRGLGKGLSDIESRLNVGRLIPTEPSTGVAEDMGDYVLIPKAVNTNIPREPQRASRNEIPEGYVPIDDSEFEAYTGIEWVTPDDDPANYGQGPDRSTRVAAHKFVPYGALMSRSLSSQASVAAGIRYGAVYVKFQNNRGRNGNVYRYDNVPDHIYQNFKNSTSKGRFINDFLNAYPYRPAGDSGL